MTGISYNYELIAFYFVYESHSLVNIAISYSLLSQIAAYRVAPQEGKIVGLRPYKPLHL